MRFTRLNNIASVYYIEARYADALRLYQQAKSKVDGTVAESWNPRRRYVTIASIAAVYQILGKKEAALGLYQDLVVSSRNLPARERAQFLLWMAMLKPLYGDLACGGASRR